MNFDNFFNLMDMFADEGTFNELLSKGVNARYKNGNTALHLAVELQDESLIKRALASGVKLSWTNYYGETPIHLAVEEGDFGVLRCLVENADKDDVKSAVNTVDSRERTPLFIAVKKERKDLVELLLDSGANPNVAGNGELYDILTAGLVYESTLPVFGAISTGNTEILKLLLERGANPNTVEPFSFLTPLAQAVAGRKKSLVSLLIKYGADPFYISPSVDNSAFREALFTSSEVFKVILESVPVDWKRAVSPFGNVFFGAEVVIFLYINRIYEAMGFIYSWDRVDYPHLSSEIVEFLIDEGGVKLTPDVVFEFVESPEFEKLLDRLSKSNVSGDDLGSMFLWILGDGKKREAKLIKKKFPDVLKFCSPDMLVCEALRNGAVKLIDEAESEGIVNFEDVNMIRRILEDLSYESKYFKYILKRFIKKIGNKKDVIKNVFLSEDAELLFTIAESENFELLKEVVEKYDIPVNVRNEDGNTLLHLYLDFNTVLWLIKKGVDVNSRNKEGKTPLHIAVESSADFKVIDALIENGADINARDNLGRTPVFYVYEFKLLKHLIELGADLNVRDVFNQTPFYKFLENGIFEEDEIFGALKISEFIDGFKRSARDKDIFGRNLLHYAVGYELTTALGMLKKEGVSVEGRDRDGRTPVFMMLMSEGMVLEKLFDGNWNKAFENCRQQDVFGNSVWHYIAGIEGFAFGRMLNLAKNEISKLNTKNKVGRSPAFLILSSVEEGFARFEKGALKNISRRQTQVKDIFGMTPLHLLMFNVGNSGSFSVFLKDLSILMRKVDSMLESGLSFSDRDLNGLDPLMYLVSGRDLKTFEVFTKLIDRYGLNIESEDSFGNNILHYASFFGNSLIVDYILNELNLLHLNKPNKFGVKPIHLSTARGSRTLEIMLSRFGADHKTQSGAGLLHFAMFFCNKDAVSILMNHSEKVLSDSDINGNIPPDYLALRTLVFPSEHCSELWKMIGENPADWIEKKWGKELLNTALEFLEESKNRFFLDWHWFNELKYSVLEVFHRKLSSYIPNIFNPSYFYEMYGIVDRIKKDDGEFKNAVLRVGLGLSSFEEEKDLLELCGYGEIKREIVPLRDERFEMLSSALNGIDQGIFASFTGDTEISFVEKVISSVYPFDDKEEVLISSLKKVINNSSGVKNAD